MTATMVRPGDAQTSPAMTHQDGSLIGMGKTTCRIGECANVARRRGRGFCAAHYYQWLRDNPETTKPKRDPRERFYEKVTPGPNGCLLFPPNTGLNGYGQFWYDGAMRSAHRWIWEFTYGPLSAGRMVCHHCDVRNCVNLGHLYDGDGVSNARDRDRRGRANVLHGEQVGTSCWSDDVVTTVRARRESGQSLSSIAKDYEGMTTQGAWQLCNRRKWPPLDPESGKVAAVTIDVTPGAHSFLDALATASFALGCGCRTRVTCDDTEAHLLKSVGNTYPCSKHGEQVIVRATHRLAGWRQPPTWRANL